MQIPQHFDADFSGDVDVWHVCGTTYKGPIENGERNGLGCLIYGNGMKYSGMFVNNKCHGQGVLRFLNGDSYEGQFEENILLPTAEGIYTIKEYEDVFDTDNDAFVSKLLGKPEGRVMCELLKKSADSHVVWPLRVYTPTTRHISTVQHNFINEIAKEARKAKKENEEAATVTMGQRYNYDYDPDYDGFFRARKDRGEKTVAEKMAARGL